MLQGLCIWINAMVAKFCSEDRYRTIAEPRIVEMLLVQGWRYEVAAGRRAQAEAEAGEALRHYGLPHVVHHGIRHFDPVEVHNFVRWAAIHLGDRVWADHLVAEFRRQAWDSYPEQTDWSLPPKPDALGYRRYEATIQRSFNLRGRKTGERLRLALPVVLGDRTLIKSREIFLQPDGMCLEAISRPDRIEALLTMGEASEIEIGVRFGFAAGLGLPGEAGTLSAADIELYTRPSEGLIKISDAVRHLSEKIGGDETAPLQILRRAWDYVFAHFLCGSIHYDRLDPAAPLDRAIAEGWIDCQTGSALLVALCRLKRIPARLVTGYLIDRLAPAPHTWFEVWTGDDGWLPFDLACWGLSLGGNDSAWRDFYFGYVERRMVVERPPLLFSSLGSIRLRGAWQMTTALSATGMSYQFESTETGDWIYRDHIAVKCKEER
jgi:hypothetical protein